MGVIDPMGDDSVKVPINKIDWLQTYTGKMFWPLNPRVEDICIEDIAHALSLICRYNGHSKYFFSVAQHSVIVSRHVSKENALWGLLHDVAEAYIGDLPSPIKNCLPEYVKLEERILKTIAKKFDLHHDMPEEVKRADAAVLAAEMKVLMGKPPREWYLPEKPLDIKIVPLYSIAAEGMFLHRYSDIRNGVNQC
jgi:hypothetical protein